jgi:thiamine-phosphate pyrophosphorylase
MRFILPRVYPILDSSYIPASGRAEFLHDLGASLADAGVAMLEYRNKNGSDDQLRSDAEILRAAMPEEQVKLILDDRADLVSEIGFDGVHVDAGDVSPKEARRIVGPGRIVGTFGGSDALLPGILDEPVNYWAVGPVYRTTTKDTDKPPIGPAGVRRLREQAGPDILLTAAAGITLDTACLVLASGANAVAVAAAIFGTPDPAAEFRRWKERVG